MVGVSGRLSRSLARMVPGGTRLSVRLSAPPTARRGHPREIDPRPGAEAIPCTEDPESVAISDSDGRGGVQRIPVIREAGQGALKRSCYAAAGASSAPASPVASWGLSRPSERSPASRLARLRRAASSYRSPRLLRDRAGHRAGVPRSGAAVRGSALSPASIRSMVGPEDDAGKLVPARRRTRAGTSPPDRGHSSLLLTYISARDHLVARIGFGALRGSNR